MTRTIYDANRRLLYEKGRQSSCKSRNIHPRAGDIRGYRRFNKRKLLPALYQLQAENRLPEPLHVIGFARRPWDDRQLKDELSAGIREFAREKPAKQEFIEQLLENSHYVQSDFQDPAGYSQLLHYLDEKSYRKVIFYLATRRTNTSASSKIYRCAGIMPTKKTEYV
jgi:glucose-6-phosphate 1-dehydrogenase